MSTAKDWQLLGPIAGVCGQNTCLAPWDCIDLTAAPEQFAQYTRNYCGVGPRRKLHSISVANPADNTLTLEGADEFIVDVIREFAVGGCATMLQRVHCSGKGEAYRLVQFGGITPTGRLTANGPNAIDDPQNSTVDAFYFDKFVWKAPNQSVPPVSLNNFGQYTDVAPIGTADGTNTVFVLDPVPDTSYPTEITVDAVSQVEGTDYTLVDGTITFAVAPVCNAVILASYYSVEFTLFGLEPVAIWFCGAAQCAAGSSCGSGCNDGCSRMHAIYNTSLVVTDDCGNTLGNRVAMATYAVSKERDEQNVSLVDVTMLDTSILNVKDALCTAGGETIISAENGLYASCGDSFVQESAPLPAGKSFGRLAYSEMTGDVYAIYGDSGVMKRGDSKWRISLRDGQLVVGVQSYIDAAGYGVITGGEFGSMQVSSTSGSQWAASQIVSAGDIYSVSAGVANEMSAASPSFFALAFDPLAQIATTRLFVSANGGGSWSQRKAWATGIEQSADISVAVDDWFMYVRIDNKIYRNTNSGCDKCDAWSDISNSGVPMRSRMAVCPNNPQRVAMVGVGGSLALAGDNFYTSGQNETATHVVLDNDLVPDGCTIDITSVVVTAAPTQGTATANLDGTVTYVSGATATGFDVYDYEVTYNCTDGTTGTLSATVRVDFLS